MSIAEQLENYFANVTVPRAQWDFRGTRLHLFAHGSLHPCVVNVDCEEYNIDGRAYYVRFNMDGNAQHILKVTLNSKRKPIRFCEVCLSPKHKCYLN